MGLYLNGTKAYTLYKENAGDPYFVDKSMMLSELIPLIGSSNKNICITRPRRFGKTVMANMIASFFGKGKESSDIFNKLKIAKSDLYQQHLNQHDVIHISFNEMPETCASYKEYIGRITQKLKKDLCIAYSEISFDTEDAVWDILEEISEYTDTKQFLFVLDEWDFIFHRNFVTEKDKENFVSFLSNLLKDKAYVSLAYMTGILPISKYSSGSDLNMFLEYNMATKIRYSDYFGFFNTEVDELYQRYLDNEKNINITREGLMLWYDGYQTASGERMYNPRSVVAALKDNQFANYWTSSGPYDEIFFYIEKNIADVRDDLALMVSGDAVPAKVREYAATSMNLNTKDEIFSAMVVYGFLSYENGKVSIPNNELMEKFSDMLQKEQKLGYINRLARESIRMLTATLSGDTTVMMEILSYAHDSEVPLLKYNNETELSSIVNLVYLAARDKYDVQREDKSGIGFVDFIFYPKTKSDDCIILELKVDHTPENAIQQIKDRKYIMRFKGKLGEVPVYTGRVLAVGIGYDKKSKKHACKIEVL